MVDLTILVKWLQLFRNMQFDYFIVLRGKNHKNQITDLPPKIPPKQILPKKFWLPVLKSTTLYSQIAFLSLQEVLD